MSADKQPQKIPFLERIKLGLGSVLAAQWIRFLIWSNERIYLHRQHLDAVHPGEERYILALWHEHLLLTLFAYEGPGITPMISKHKDGEWISRTLRRLDVVPVRGSTSRGGSAALRAMVRTIRSGRDGAFTPDGPKGPRRTVQQGILLASQLSGAPILPVGMASTKGYRLDSWDRFLVAYPFGKLIYAYAEPIQVPSGAKGPELEAIALDLQNALNAVSIEAEQVARELA